MLPKVMSGWPKSDLERGGLLHRLECLCKVDISDWLGAQQISELCDDVVVALIIVLAQDMLNILFCRTFFSKCAWHTSLLEGFHSIFCFCMRFRPDAK